jgi:hypothetical protein
MQPPERRGLRGGAAYFLSRIAHPIEVIIKPMLNRGFATPFSCHLSNALSYLLSGGISQSSKAPETVMASAERPKFPLPPSFSRGLADFQKRLSAEQIEEFRFATFQSLQEAVESIQRQQAKRQSFRNLNKIRPFIDGLTQYSGIIELFVNIQPLVAAIWVSFIELDILNMQESDENFRVQSNFVSKYGLLETRRNNSC